MSGKQAHSCAVSLSWGSLLWNAAPSRPGKEMARPFLLVLWLITPIDPDDPNPYANRY